MSEAEIKRGPGRPSRQQETQQRRRRRETLGDERHLKLGVPDALKDPSFEYRWINETGNRIQSKTEMDDWDIVKSPVDPAKDDGEGSPVRRAVGTVDGKPQYAFLCRKPKEFYVEDKKAEQNLIKADEDALRRGQVKGSDALSGPHAYVPGTNRISHGGE